MKLRIEHVTQYDYSVPLKYAHQSLCLTPQANAHQTVHEWALQAPGPLFEQRDGYGNLAHTWTLMRRSFSGRVVARGVVETHASPWLLDEEEGPPALMYLRPTRLTEADATLRQLARSYLGDGVNDQTLLALADEVLRRVPYESGVTSVATTAREALAVGKGVCQDHAHVFIAACRSLGIPARYVSGYFHAPEAPHLASHAWVDVCADASLGHWLSVDPTHLCLMDERHVRLAVGPDYAACSPIRGVREGGGEEKMKVQIRIEPIETPLTTDTPPEEDPLLLQALES
jgi:transglutaminase-like putative cysteine protease